MTRARSGASRKVRKNHPFPPQAASDCVPVPPGAYAVGAGNVAPAGPCDPGYFCMGRATTPTPADGSGFGGECSPGALCPAGSTWDAPCPGGRYCDGTQILGTCARGHWCRASATTPTPSDGVSDDFGVCPPGHYCPRGSTLPSSCPPGTYLSSSGNANRTDCQPCSGWDKRVMGSHHSLERGSPVISRESPRVSTPSRDFPLRVLDESSSLVSRSLEESGPCSPC